MERRMDGLLLLPVVMLLPGVEFKDCPPPPPLGVEEDVEDVS